MADEGPSEQRPDERTPLIRSLSNDRDSGILRRSWHSMAEMINPFSSGALSLLPKQPFKGKQSSVRTDTIPDPQSISEVRDYHSINATLPPEVRIPKKIATPINVEGKVWFANERSTSNEIVHIFFSLSADSMGGVHQSWHRPRDTFLGTFQRI